METYFIILMSSIAVVLAYDWLGAVISRKFDINYTHLSFISLFFYLFIGYVSAAYIDIMASMTITGLVGLVDTLIGWRIVRGFDANVMGEEEKALLEMTEPPVEMVIGVVLMSMGTGWLGGLFA